MRRGLADGFEVDDDRDRVDIDAVYGFLTNAYWALGRSRDTVARLVREAAKVVAAYAPDGALVGFCRVVSDAENMAWLGDVFVLPEYRGRGLGAELVREAVEDHRFRDLQWYLGTRDAHALYAKFGFTPANDRTMVRAPRSRR